ncbi:MAG: UDP-3-O-acyl-N-acetylglucosamine deacetylase [Bacteroidales bacterium]|nr:UDP-3-O-acyl-N-acetylglucosamine deacetylase [Bacteroidales bacterium]
MRQNTLANPCYFEGKGLHTGQYAHMYVWPAAAGTGIRFIRTDLGDACIEALADNVTNTARSTTVSCGEASAITVEHILSAMTGMGIDNAEVRIDNAEVPILDGSALPYVEAFLKAGIVAQDAPRHFLELNHAVEVRDEKSGAWVKVEPSDKPSTEITVDFGSKVLGVQNAGWDLDTDYASAIAPCRTFVFFHEIEFLARQGLVKGGDVSNAIVIIEHPVTQQQIDDLCSLLGLPSLKATENGYLSNLKLHFPDECGRHKLLDIIGDLRLAGGWLNARVTAFKPGHTINTIAAKEIRKALILK